MEKEVNTQLLERANELLEEIDSHPSRLDIALKEALQANDLESVHYLVNLIEGELAKEHFYSKEMGVF